jgi:hypothetical protein
MSGSWDMCFGYLDVVPDRETRDQRIRREDQEFDIYGRALLQRWIEMDVPHSRSSYRTRGTRRRATQTGQWLCRPEALEWLERYGVKVNDFLDITCVTRSVDGINMDATTTVLCGRGIMRHGGYTWEVRIDGMFPKPPGSR